MDNLQKSLPSALLVGMNTSRDAYEIDLDSLDELSLLSETSGFQTAGKLLLKRERIDPAFYIGIGKAQNLRKTIIEKTASAVLFDFDLSPVQLRNLEKVLKCRIMSRTEVILDIFEQRARTREAQLQVELATLMYSLPRLRHMWPHLNRIAGYIGARGPGEKQLEQDRRRISQRINKIKKDLASVRTHRMVMRRNRRFKYRATLVGYTNGGKSSLLNALAHSSLPAENRLFSTLDPATREVWLGEGAKSLITDTVGFIKRLPHTLIASFRATLEEVKDADILIHVVDISAPDAAERIEAVDYVLKEISADSLPVLYAFNKIDLLRAKDIKASLLSRYPRRVLVSAKTGEGLGELRERLLDFFRTLPHLVPAQGAHGSAALRTAAPGAAVGDDAVPSAEMPDAVATPEDELTGSILR